MNSHLKLARAKKGLTQKELSALVHVSRQAYSLYERGKREPDWDTMVALSQVLDVSVEYLIGATDSPLPTVSLDHREQAFLHTYQLLDERGKTMIDITLQEQRRYSAVTEDEES